MTNPSTLPIEPPAEFKLRFEEPPRAEQGSSYPVEVSIDIPVNASPNYLSAIRTYMSRMAFKKDVQLWLDQAHPGFGVAHEGLHPVLERTLKDGQPDRSSRVVAYRATIKLSRPI